MLAMLLLMHCRSLLFSLDVDVMDVDQEAVVESSRPYTHKLASRLDPQTMIDSGGVIADPLHQITNILAPQLLQMPKHT